MIKTGAFKAVVIPAILTLVVLTTGVFGEHAGKIPSKMLDAEISAAYNTDDYGNTTVNLNADAFPTDNASYHTARLKWNSGLFNLKSHKLVGKETQLLDVLEGDGELVVFLPPGASMKMNVVLGTNAQVPKTTKFELDLISSSPSDNGVSSEPVLKTLHKEFVLNKSLPGNTASTLPEKYALRQNHPNPFNPTTEIEYDLPEGCKVQIMVFDVLGKEICTLVDSEMPAGFHKVNWDGTTSDGAKISSGLYFIKMKTPKVEEVIKTQLIK